MGKKHKKQLETKRHKHSHTHRNTTKHKTPSQDLQGLKKDTIKNSSDFILC